MILGPLAIWRMPTDIFPNINIPVEELNNLPVRSANNGILYVRDVAHVRDGFVPQINIVRVDN